VAAATEAEPAEENWLGESPIAAGLLVMALLSVAAWWNGHHPVAASGLIAQAAAALLAAQRIVPLLATGRPTAAVGVPMKPVVVLTRVVIGAGVAATLAALAVILVGSDKEWPARLGYGGLAFATVGLFGYVFFYVVRVLSDDKPRRSSLDRRLAEFVLGRLGADFPATLAFYLVIVGSALQILGA
jgi:multisubunit Na+/H+ antiporter MnhC subunit